MSKVDRKFVPVPGIAFGVHGNGHEGVVSDMSLLMRRGGSVSDGLADFNFKLSGEPDGTKLM